MCIRSVILGELENYIILTRNWKGFSVTFSKILDVSKNFAYFFFGHIFESGNFRFLFSTKNIITFRVKSEKLKLRKS